MTLQGPTFLEGSMRVFFIFLLAHPKGRLVLHDVGQYCSTQEDCMKITCHNNCVMWYEHMLCLITYGCTLCTTCFLVEGFMPTARIRYIANDSSKPHSMMCISQQLMKVVHTTSLLACCHWQIPVCFLLGGSSILSLSLRRPSLFPCSTTTTIFGLCGSMCHRLNHSGHYWWQNLRVVTLHSLHLCMCNVRDETPGSSYPEDMLQIQSLDVMLQSAGHARVHCGPPTQYYVVVQRHPVVHVHLLHCNIEYDHHGVVGSSLSW